jgi:hypothetical protein
MVFISKGVDDTRLKFAVEKFHSCTKVNKKFMPTFFHCCCTSPVTSDLE